MNELIVTREGTIEHRPKFEATPVSGTGDAVCLCDRWRERGRGGRRGRLHVREGDRTAEREREREREDKREGKRSSLHPLAFTALYRRGYRFRGTNSEKRALPRVVGTIDRNKKYHTVDPHSFDRHATR